MAEFFAVSGLVLGVLPLLISAVGAYENFYRTFVTGFEECEPSIQSFQQGLHTEKALFRNGCRLLLMMSVDDLALVQEMLTDLKHDGWKDCDVERKVSQFLGDSEEECRATIARIRGKLSSILEEYDRYGINFDSDPMSHDISHIHRAYGKLKFCWSQERLGQHLQELSTMNLSFRALCEQVRLLNKYEQKSSWKEGIQRPKSTIDKYTLVQKASNHLCRSLSTACISHTEHSAHFDLDVESKDSGVMFKLALKSKVFGTKQNPVWLGVHSKPNGAPGPKEHIPRERPSPPKITGSICSHQSVGISHEKNSGYKFFSWHHSRQSTIGSTYLGPSSDDVLSLSDKTSESETLVEEHHQTLEIRQNLCDHVLLHSRDDAKGAQSRRLIGCLDRDKSIQHLIYLTPPQALPEAEWTFSLSDLISSAHSTSNLKKLSPYGKLRLAKQLAVALLQFHSTPLLERAWQTKNIIFFNPDLDSRKGGVSLSSPHLRLDFRASDSSELPDESNREESDDEDEDENGIRNQYLYQLAIIFLELAYLQPISQLREQHGEQEWGTCERAEYKLAQRLSKMLTTQYGPKFGRVIRKCLACDFGQGTNLTDVELQEAFHRDVIGELESLEEGFARLYGTRSLYKAF